MKKNKIKELKTFSSMEEPAIMQWSCKPIIYSNSLTNSRTTFEFIYKYFPENIISFREQFVLLFLNRNNKVIGTDILSIGGKAGTLVDVSIVVGKAAITNSSAIVIAHNHPSGNLKPSNNDKEITKIIKQALKLLDITLIDHLIVTEGNCYYSFADEGEL